MRMRCPNCDSPDVFEDEDRGVLVCEECGEEIRIAGTRRSSYRDDDDYEERPRRRLRPRTPVAVASMGAVLGFLCGVVSCLVFCLWPLGLPLSIAGVVLCIIFRGSTSPRLAVSGFVLSATGLIFSLGFMVLTIAGISLQDNFSGLKTPPPFFPTKP
jgi:TFIIB zinc-binding